MAVFDAIRDVVLVLNDVSARNRRGFETGEREKLCAYIETALEEVGVDVDALASRRGMSRHEITDEWRTW